MKTPTIPIFVIEEVAKKQLNDLKTKNKEFKEKRLTCCSWLRISFKNFCRKSEVQGVRYIVRPENSLCEKYGWAVTIIVIIIVTLVLLYLAYTWDASTPTVTVISKPFYPLWNIPFPAVTICHFNLISKNKMEKLLKKLRFPNDKSVPDQVIIDQIRKVLYYTGSHFYEKEFNDLKALMSFNNLSIAQIKDSTSPDCNEILIFCKWKGESKLCETFFQKINTTEGVCCSFNYYAEMDDNFPENIKVQIPELPRKISGFHLKVGLTVVLNSQINDYMTTYLSSYGFRLFLHDSYDYADENSETKVLNSNQESFIRIIPEQIKATSDIKKLAIKNRNCYFRDEQKLNYFRNYSYTNCLVECRALNLHKLCGCIQLRSANNGSAPICNFDHMPCIYKYQKTIGDTIIGGDIQTMQSNETVRNVCSHCLPNCEFNIYKADLSTSRLNFSYSYANQYSLQNQTKGDFIVLHVFYSDLYTNLYLTHLFQDWISTLAAFGGIIGLMSNINLMSLVELGFYIFLKPFFRTFENDSDYSDNEDDN